MTEFRIKLTEEHADEFLRRMSRSRGLNIWLIVLLVLLAVFAFLQAVGEDSFDFKRFIIIAVGGLAGLALFLLLRFYLRKRVLKPRLLENPYFKFENTYRLENGNLSYSNEVSSLRISLSDVRRVLETANLYIIQFIRSSALILPKEQTPEDVRNSLLPLIRKKRNKAH